MKSTFICLKCLVFVALMTHISCKKESTPGPGSGGGTSQNKAPIANAGLGGVITLPVDSVYLNGSASYDPDGTISSFLWTKGAGPSPGNIVHPQSAQTLVTGLTSGSYRFDLTVTDNKGLRSTSSTTVTVLYGGPPFQCDNSNRPVIQASLIPVGNLSYGRTSMSVASAGNKILFAGGHGSNEDGWGVSRVDIYDISTQSWATAELSAKRYGISAVASGDKIFFAGGEHGDGAFNTLFSNVDIYNASTNSWSTAYLSMPRTFIGSAAVGNKVIFAGGEYNSNYETTNRVDIFDIVSNTWSTAALSEGRSGISAVTVGDKVYFAGGNKEDRYYDSPSSKIDVYDHSTNTWSQRSLNETKAFLSGITNGNKIYWAGGTNGNTIYSPSCQVEIWDPNTQNSTIDYLYKPGGWSPNDGQNAVIKDNKIIFLRTYRWTTNWPASDKFDIYDIATGTWSIGVLPGPLPYHSSVISVNNNIYIAGGMTDESTRNLTNKVWKLEF